jgi:hypothetical protein
MVRVCIVGALLSAVVGPVWGEVSINEIMYNSPGSPDVEYVELVNHGPNPVDLAGWTLLDADDAHTPCQLAGTLQPGDYVVVPGLLDEFTATYPGLTNVNPNPFDSPTPGVGFALGNTSDQVRLFDDGGTLVDAVTYADAGAWPVEADGDGPSLELLNPFLDNDLPSSWAASVGGPPGGTPGAENSVFIADLAPLIGSVARDLPLPGAGDTVTVTAQVADDIALSTVELFVDLGGGFVPRRTFDDGAHGDGEPGDGVYGAFIEAQPDGSLVRYYILATDSSAQATSSPADAPTSYLAYTVGHVPPSLEIHEIVASNQNGLTDGAGDTDDWVELGNVGPVPVDLTGMFLSGAFAESRAWELPSTTLEPGERVILWCDDETVEGPFHASFTLPREGGEIALFDTVDHGNVMIRGLRYGPQGTDIPFGFAPEDADAPEYLATATPGLGNTGIAPFSPVCINEFFTTSQVGVPDWIELYNRSGVTVNIGGWHLSDDLRDPQKYTILAGTMLGAGEFLVFDETTLGFSLRADGSEEIVLTAADGATGQDFFDYGPQLDDISQGRLPDGSPNWHYFSAWTQNGGNSCDPGPPPPDPVDGVRFTAPATLTWDALEDAEAYDVLEGSLEALRAGGGSFTTAVTGCAENNGQDLESWAGASPSPGQGVFYLVRGVTFSCGFGTYDSGSGAQVAPRDASIAAAVPTCP